MPYFNFLGAVSCTLSEITFMIISNLFQVKSLKIQPRLTKRAPDAGESEHISSSFLRLVIFLVGRLRRPRPSAGNANRWAVDHKEINNRNLR